MGKPVVDLSGKREVFWDDFMIEPEKTEAELRLHKPVKKEMVMHLNMPWEGDGCDYYNIMNDDGLYRMYYLGWYMINPGETEHTGSDIKVCYAESRDGIHWTRPNLGIVEWKGSKENNIILGHETDIYDNFFAFKDTNPNCKPEEKYKGVAECGRDGSLWGYTSEDAIHWNRVAQISTKGKFDSLNTAFWDHRSGKYYCYIRDFHDTEETDEYGIRDVRFITSDDFWHWSDPTMLEYMGGADYPLYTNNVGPYYRADHIWTGFPTRYVQRTEWTKNTDRLAGAEKRKQRCALEDRLGLTVTDAVFMSSRDGKNWHRFDEAWLTPGPEHMDNWVYGDCYPAYGMIQTPSEYAELGADDEISMYNFEGKWSAKPSKLYRYTIRLDGFASYYGKYPGQTVVTRPFTFTGNTLKVNFASSARGGMYIKVLDEDFNEIDGFETCEIYGDKVDRIIDFENGKLADLAGRTIRLSFMLSDCDLYSFIIE